MIAIDRLIVSPVTADIEPILIKSSHLRICTAFYSKGMIERLPTTAKKIDFYCRLNMKNGEDWKAGIVDPKSLYQQLEKCQKSGVEVSIYVHPLAHAKIYASESVALIGSANFSVRGFGAGKEVIGSITRGGHIRRVQKAIVEYGRGFSKITVADLGTYVAKHEPKTKIQFVEEKVAPESEPKDRKFGDYEDFKLWLRKRPGGEAKEIFDRANGKGGLSGHIWRNFYGLRQFFISRPDLMRKFCKLIEAGYALHADGETKRALKEFVHRHATDEEDFSLSKWKTYLPDYLRTGLPARKGGATSGNLNRMLPLVAAFMMRM